MTKAQIKNVYDQFAAEWSSRAAVDQTHAYIEKPAMLENVDELSGRSVLCIGCGDGREVALIASAGGENIKGVDLSDELVKIAQESYPMYEFAVADVENLAATERYDVVWGSFVMHYFEDWAAALRSVEAVLKPGGQFIFSIPHPIKYSLSQTKNETSRSNLMGYSKNLSDKGFEVYGDYLNHTPHRIDFSENLSIECTNVPLGERINSVIASGLDLEKLVEPQPIQEMKDVAAREYEIRSRIPSVAIFSLRKPS